MFDNIGEKLKEAAVVLMAIAIVGGTIGIIVSLSEFGYSVDTIDIICLVSVVLGMIFSIITSYALYAFGELVENTDMIVSALSKMNKESQNTPANEQSVSNTETTLANEANSTNTADTNFAAPTNPASTMNPVVSNMTSPANQNTAINQPATPPSDLKVFTCPWCGSRYKARTHRVICPSCHKKID